MSDLERTAASLAARLPEPLRPLARLAYNMRWSWMPGGDELFASIDRERWQRCRANPVRLLLEASNEALEAAAADDEFLARMGELTAAVETDLARPDSTAVDGTVAFFCAEYGVHRSLPIYSGGLGALAGDILKQASDDALPVVAVGLMYREGYFRQRIDATGWQQESWVDSDPDRLPMALVTTPEGGPLVGAHPGRRERHHRAGVGGAGRPRAAAAARHRPSRQRRRVALDHRAAVRRRPGAAPRRSTSCSASAGCACSTRSASTRRSLHLNEGHAAFAALELARRGQRGGASLDEALAAARARTVFTTHTPVPAGNDTYSPNHLAHAVGRAADEMGLGVDGARPDGAHEPRRPERAVRRHPVRAAHQPRGQRRERPPRRGRALHVERAVAGALGGGRADHVGDERRAPAHLGRRPDPPPARPPSRRGVGGARDRPGHVGGPGRDLRRGAVGRAVATAVGAHQPRARAQRPRAPGPRRHARLRPRGRALRPGRADDRVRAPRRDVQAHRPAPRPARREPVAAVRATRPSSC